MISLRAAPTAASQAAAARQRRAPLQAACLGRPAQAYGLLSAPAARVLGGAAPAPKPAPQRTVTTQASEASDSSATSSSFFTDVSKMETAYTALMVPVAVFSVAFALFPAWCVETGLRTVTTPAITNFMGWFSSYGIATLGVLYTLRDAAKHDRLSSNTYKTLNLTVAALAATLLGLQLASLSVTNGALLLGYALVLVPLLVVTGGAYLAWGGETSVTALAQALVPKNWTAAVYAALSIPYLVFFVWAGVLPHHPLVLADIGAVGQYVKRKVGLGLVLFFGIHAALKDAADRGRLGASTFKALNLTLSVVCVVSAYYLWQFKTQVAAVSWLLPALLAEAAITVLWCDYQYFFAKK